MKNALLKKVNALILLVVMVICLLPVMTASAAFTLITKGDGSPEDPYQIETEAQFKELVTQSKTNNFAGVYFKLMNNISYTAAPISTNDVRDNHCIGTSQGAPANYFRGTFDGNGQVITIDIRAAAVSNNMGLFSYLGDGGVVKDLGVAGVMTNANNSSPLVANNFFGTISNCYNTASISGTGWLGGIVGVTQGGTIENCYNAGSITGTAGIGGIAGNSRNINGSTTASSTIRNCYNAGNVLGTGDVGGIIGLCSASTYAAIVQNCYNSGNVKTSGTGSSAFGGIAGNVGNPVSSITNSYNMAHIAREGTSAGNFGGIFGNTSLVAASSGINRSWIGANLCLGNTEWPPASGNAPDSISTTALSTAGTNAAGTSKSGLNVATPDTWFMTQSNYTIAGWNFTTVWEWHETGTDTGYPKLRNTGGDQTGFRFVFDTSGQAAATHEVILTTAVNGTLTADPMEINDGQSVMFQMTADFGYMLDTLTVNNNPIDSSAILGDVYTTSKYSFGPVTGNVTAEATFKPRVLPFTGDGTSGAPYLISDQDEYNTFVALTQKSSFKDIYFKLTSNVTHVAANGGDSAFIGNIAAIPFEGIFDGGGKTITLNVATPGRNDVSLFRFLGASGVVENLAVAGAITFGLASQIGGVVGNNNGGTIRNCTSAMQLGNVSNPLQNQVGGIVGLMTGGVVENCYFTGSVRGRDVNHGGIVGQINSTLSAVRISNCYNTGAVNSVNYGHTGGIVGMVTNTTGNKDVIIENCYNTGAITSGSGTDGRTQWASGIAGNVVQANAVIRNCYNAGDITSGHATTPQPKGIYNGTAVVTNSFSWDGIKLNNVLITAVDFENVQNGFAVTDVNLTKQSTYSTWTFSQTAWKWEGNSADRGYPALAPFAAEQPYPFPFAYPAVYAFDITAIPVYDTDSVSVTLNIKNTNGVTLTAGTAVMIAVYDGNNLVGIDYNDTTIDNLIAGTSSSPITLTANTGILAANTYTVKIMLWEDMSNAIPMIEAKKTTVIVTQ